MRLFDKVKTISEGIKMKSLKPVSESKEDAQYHHIHDEENADKHHGSFEMHDGELISSSASSDAQETGIYEKAAKKAGVKKDDIVMTTPSMVAAQMGTSEDKEDNRTEDKIKVAKMQKADKATDAKAAEIKAKYKAANKPAVSVSYDAGIPTTPSNAKNFIAKMKEIKEKAKLGKTQGVPEGADQATHERCVQKVKAQGHDKGSAFAICNAAGAGMKKGDVIEMPKKPQPLTADRFTPEGRGKDLAKMKAMMEAAKKKKAEESGLQKGYEKDESGNLVYKKDSSIKAPPAATISYGSKGVNTVEVTPGTKPADSWKKDWANKPQQAKTEFVSKLANQRATGQKQETPIGGQKPKTAIQQIKEKQMEVNKSSVVEAPLPPPAAPPQPQLMKDDAPHAPNSPEDKAHDIVEENQSLKSALSALSSKDKMKSMFAHLRDLKEKQNLRSPENQAAGQEVKPSLKSAWLHKGCELMKKTKWNPTLDF